jgi:DNA-directed RNA polymerase II subunit RPB2
MYEPEDEYMAGAGGMDEEESEEIPNEIWQEACWIVISAYFEEKGNNHH